MAIHSWAPKNHVCESREAFLNSEVCIFSFASLINLKNWNIVMFYFSLPVTLAASVAVFLAIDWLWIRQVC